MLLGQKRKRRKKSYSESAIDPQVLLCVCVSLSFATFAPLSCQSSFLIWKDHALLLIPYSIAGMNFQASLLSSSLPINPPASGPSLTFSQSTQARNWLFTPTSLSTLRSEIATDSISDLTHLWQQEHLLQKQEANQDDPPPIPPKLEFPTVEESKALIDFWLAKIPPIVRAFGLPIVVETTAMTYLKRFFLRHPVWGFEVKDVM